MGTRWLADDDWEANRYRIRATPITPAAGSNLQAGNSPSLQTGKLNISSAPILATSFSNEFQVFSGKNFPKVTDFLVESFNRGETIGMGMNPRLKTTPSKEHCYCSTEEIMRQSTPRCVSSIVAKSWSRPSTRHLRTSHVSIS